MGYAQAEQAPPDLQSFGKTLEKTAHPMLTRSIASTI